MEGKEVNHKGLRTLFASLALWLAGCEVATPIKDGDSAVTIRNTPCWRYPGGAKALQDERNSPGQTEYGGVPPGTPLTVVKGENQLDIVVEGHVRVKVPSGTKLTRNPLPGELGAFVPVDEHGDPIDISTIPVPEDGQICWLELDDVKMLLDEENKIQAGKP